MTKRSPRPVRWTVLAVHYSLAAAVGTFEVLGLRRPAGRIAAAALRIALRPLLRWWFHLEVHGAETLPQKGPVLLCPNHQSRMDPAFLGLSCPRDLVPMARHDAFDIPIIGPLMRFFNAEPINRGAGEEAVEQAADILRRREGFLVIFPEGTTPGEEDKRRSDVDPDTGLLRGKTGPVRIAVAAGAPIVPVGISGTGALLPPEAVPLGKTRIRLRRGRIVIRFGPPFRPSADPGSLRRETDRLMREISGLVDFSLSLPPYRPPLGPADYAMLRAFEAGFDSSGSDVVRDKACGDRC